MVGTSMLRSARREEGGAGQINVGDEEVGRRNGESRPTVVVAAAVGEACDGLGAAVVIAAAALGEPGGE